VVMPDEHEVPIVLQLATGKDDDATFRRVNVRAHRHGKLDAIAMTAVGLLAEPGNHPPPDWPTELSDAVCLLLSGSVVLRRLRLICLRFGGRRSIAQGVRPVQGCNTLLLLRVDDDGVVGPRL